MDTINTYSKSIKCIHHPLFMASKILKEKIYICALNLAGSILWEKIKPKEKKYQNTNISG